MKKIVLWIFALYALLGCNNADAQTPGWQWAKRATGFGDDAGRSMAIDADGNVYVLGIFTSYTFSFGTTVLVNADGGSPEVYLAKYDSSGNFIWATSAFGDGSDKGNGITITDDNEIVIVGSFGSDSILFDAFTLYQDPGVSSYYDIFIAKYDSAGQVMWAKKYGAEHEDLAFAVANDHSGFIYMTGQVGGDTVFFDTDTLISVFKNFFIARLDGSGTTQWVKSSTGNCYQAGTSIALDQNANAFCVGTFGGDSIAFDGITLPNSGVFGTEESFVVKYDSSGAAVWAKRIGGGLPKETAKSVAVDHMGNIIVTGGARGPVVNFDTLTLNIPVYGGTDNLFIAKYNFNGNILWAKQGGTSDNDMGNSVTTDTAGNIYFAGVYDTKLVLDNDSLMNPSTRPRLYVAKLSEAGSTLWLKSTDSTGYTEVTDMELYGDDLYVTGGYTFPVVLFDTIVLFGLSTLGDAFVARLHQPVVQTSVLEIDDDFNVTLFPNPVNTTLTVQLDDRQDAFERIEIVDASGRKVFEKITGSENRFHIDVSLLPVGFYFLRTVTRKQTSVLKFIKE